MTEHPPGAELTPAGPSALAAAGHPGDVPPPGHPPAHRRSPAEERRAERLVATFFLISALGTVGWIVSYVWGNPALQYYTPVFGVGFGMSFGGLGIGMVLWAKKIMPEEVAVQDREPFPSPPAERAVAAEEFTRSFEATGLGRFRLLRRTLLIAAGALGLPFIVALKSLGPNVGTELDYTHFHKGTRLVDVNNNPIHIGDLQIGGAVTVFPENHVADAALSIAWLIRLPPGLNRPLPGRADWTYDGHISYSKICTHAGCPVGLYEQETHHLLCPCHQSLFDVIHGCAVLFGPATRPLPQLPITVDAEGYFIAKQGFDQPVGPGFWQLNLS